MEPWAAADANDLEGVLAARGVGSIPGHVPLFLALPFLYFLEQKLWDNIILRNIKLGILVNCWKASMG